MARKLGDAVREYPWINHQIWENCKEVGTTSRKNKVSVDQTFAAADVRITLSGIKIHAVGPVWNGGDKGEDELLASCYRTALALAAEYRLASIAFPAISTGIYGFPADLAARIAVGTVVSEVSAAPRGIAHVVFCCFAPEAAEHHKNAFMELGLA